MSQNPYLEQARENERTRLRVKAEWAAKREQSRLRFEAQEQARQEFSASDASASPAVRGVAAGPKQGLSLVPASTIATPTPIDPVAAEAARLAAPGLAAVRAEALADFRVWTERQAADALAAEIVSAGRLASNLT